MSTLQLRPLIIVRQHADTLFSACSAFAPHLVAYGDERELALEELLDFLAEYFAELPADELLSFVVPEQAELREVTVSLAREDLPRGDRVRTPVGVSVIVLSTHTKAKWVMLPALAQVAYVAAEDERGFDQAVRDEVVRLVAASELDGTSYLDLLPPLSFELERPLVEVDLERDGKHDEQLAKRRRQAQRLLDQIGRKVERDYEELVGRELGDLQALLMSKQPSGIVLVGPEGSGKSAWLRAAATSAGRDVYATSGAELVAGQSALGQLEERVAAVVSAAELLDVVLYFENLEDLFAGRSSDHEDFAGLLRRPLQRGKLRLVGELTPEAHDRLSQRHVGFFSHLQRFGVSPLSRAQSLEVLARRSRRNLRRGERGLDEPGRAQLLALVERYEPYRVLPGKAVRLFDELVGKAPELGEEVRQELTADDVLAGFAVKSGIPAFLLRDDRSLEFASIERFFAQHVVGQAEAIRRVAQTLCSVKAGLQPTGKPLAALLFVGPTGVGKTELSKALAQFLFGSVERMVRFDMSEYTDAYAADRLIRGSDRSDGVLTRRVREQPFGVVLLDEIEKAHSSVFDLLLQVLGEGRLSDARGRVAHFDNTIIILTSNLGVQYRRPSVGFGSTATSDDARYYVEQVERHFRPELVGRLDAIVAFSSLRHAEIRRVAQLCIERVARRSGLEGRGSQLAVSEAALDILVEGGFSPQYGARALRRHLDEVLVAPLASLISSLGSKASAALFQVRAVSEPNENPSQVVADGYVPSQLAPVVQGGIAISALVSTRRKREQSSGIDAVSRMRRAMRRWHALHALKEARERRSEVSAQLVQAKKQRTPSSTITELQREHSKLLGLLQPLDDALREVEGVESLLIAALDEVAPDLEPEARSAHDKFKVALLRALFQLSAEDELSFALHELDDRHVLHEFLLPLLRFARSLSWEVWLHFDRAPRSPESGWPPLAERRWGPPLAAALYLSELPVQRPSESVLIRVRGPGAGALLSFYMGRYRYHLLEGYGELWARPLIARYELRDDDWTQPRLSAAIDRPSAKRQPLVFSAPLVASGTSPDPRYSHPGTGAAQPLEHWVAFSFERALTSAQSNVRFLSVDEGRG
ncbi:MAG: AAA family ATPase [Myxococcota bacterium]